MQERTVPLPLSGAEVREALLDKIGSALDRDCFLHPAASYDYFLGKISIDLTLHDAGQEMPIKTEVIATRGTPVEGSETSKVEVLLEEQPPNQVRVETGQRVPTDTGKRILYSRKTAGKEAQ